mmetsp:Transcript_22371/g.52723  ORF Transcript_22371/g.52723 Transcript_22371/m.52723 type:complete len:124 (+) Transcript_22371:1145-1516(+)
MVLRIPRRQILGGHSCLFCPGAVLLKKCLLTRSFIAMMMSSLVVRFEIPTSVVLLSLFSSSPPRKHRFCILSWANCPNDEMTSHSFEVRSKINSQRLIKLAATDTDTGFRIQDDQEEKLIVPT